MAQKKKKPAARSAKAKAAMSSRLMLALLIALGWILGIIALFGLGAGGRLLQEIGTLLVGCYFFVLLVTFFCWSIWYVLTNGRKLPHRVIWGYCFLALSWILVFTLGFTTADDPFSALRQLNASLPDFWQGTFFSFYGYTGALLGGTLCLLVARAGTLIFALGFLVMGILFCFWPWLRLYLMTSPKKSIERFRQSVTRKKEKDQKKKKEKEESASAQEPAIFNGGIRADFADEPWMGDQPYVDPEDLIQDPLPGFPALEPDMSSAKKKPKPAKKQPEPVEMGDIDPIQSMDCGSYVLPPVSLLEVIKNQNNAANVRNVKEQGEKLISILREFNVDATLGEIHIGPSVTEFELIPGQGVRVNTFVNLQSDIKMALAAKDIRVEAPIPGKSAVGIEVPNAQKSMVSMGELMRSFPANLADKPLAFCLGKDLMGTNVYGRLDTMPHLLIAGATGSGKSVCVNAIICSLLMRTRPDEVKLLLVDPKKVEFTPYNGIPHLLAPVITDAQLASNALKVICEMMDARYSLFEQIPVRNISSYNDYVAKHPEEERPKMPRIVVIIDELADLMTTASKEVEQSIQRITQLARAAGIHLIVATQRPSVNVITGTIKANIPSRIAFMVSSKTDARTILDSGGAEKLLGHGDMLFEDNGATASRRIQGVFIQDHEVDAICKHVKAQGTPEYEDSLVMLKDISTQGGDVEMGDEDPLYEEVRHFVIISRKASTSLIQRRFRIGYGRAARILDQLEYNGIIGPSNGSKPREILVSGPMEDDEGDL